MNGEEGELALTPPLFDYFFRDLAPDAFEPFELPARFFEPEALTDLPLRPSL